MSLKRACRLLVGSLLVVGILGCRDKPGPVEEPKAVPKPGPVALPEAVAEPEPVAKPETVAEPGPVVEEPTPTTARVIGRDEAMAEIEKLGGTYQLNEKSPDRPMVGVALRGPRVTDAGLERLTGLTKLQLLILGGTRVTDGGLEHLKGLTNLHILSLENSKITDAGLEHLKGLTSLQHLFLGATQVTDAGVNELKKALPNVTVNREVVDIKMAGDDAKRSTAREVGRDVAITVIEQLQGSYRCDEKSPDRPIVAVWLAGPQVTDDALKYLNGLTCLQTLDLQHHTQVSDAGLEHLKDLTSLDHLWLSAPQVSDAGLEHLKGLTSLRTLHLDDTQVTARGMIRLRRALPNVTWLDVKPEPPPPPRPGRDAVIAAIEKLGGTYRCDEEHPDKPIIRVWLYGPQVTDDALEYVAALPGLQFLFLGGTQVTDFEVHRFRRAFPDVEVKVVAEEPKRTTVPEAERDAAITAIEKLRGHYQCDEETPDRPIVTVWLHGPQITDARLERVGHLHGLTTVETLDLVDTRVTDAGLEHLKGLTALTRLNLINTQVTDAGVNELNKALPNCTVSVSTRNSSGPLPGGETGGGMF